MTTGCGHPLCDEQATDERGGVPLCRGHFFLVLSWEQPAPVEEATA